MIKKYLQFVLVLAMAVVGYSQVAMGDTPVDPSSLVFKEALNSNVPTQLLQMPPAQAPSGVTLSNNLSTTSNPVNTGNGAATTKLEKACAGAQGAMFCGMAVLSAAQLIQSLTAKSGAKTTRDGFKNEFTGDFTLPGDDPTIPDTTRPPNTRNNNTNTNNNGLDDSEMGRWAADANGTLARMKAKGYTFDPKTDTVTTPKGKFPTKAFASGAAMADAGLISPDQVGAIDAALKDLAKDKYRVVSMGVGGGGGGGGGSSYSSPKIVYEDPYAAYGALGAGADGDKPNAPKTEGLTRTLASGESIGSSVDDIFKMVTRRYQVKASENTFVGD
jgi:hypothetical protein